MGFGIWGLGFGTGDGIRDGFGFDMKAEEKSKEESGVSSDLQENHFDLNSSRESKALGSNTMLAI